MPAAHQSDHTWLLTLRALPSLCVPAAALAAAAAMDRAAAAYLQEQQQQRQEEEDGMGRGGAALHLWGPAALDQLLFALRSDPSVRVRREAMRVLSSVAVEVGSPQVGAALRCIAVRCAVPCCAVQLL